MDEFMQAAIDEAQAGAGEGGVPIGSVLVRDGKILARGRNKRVQEQNPILHGEMDCLNNAGRIGSYRDTVIYSTLMPCYMCAGTIVQFKIPKVIVGESRTFPGAVEFMRSHGVEDVRSFAFPFGSVDLAAKKLLSDGPALRGVTPGVNHDQVDLNMLKACGLQNDQGGMQRALAELETLDEQDGWLIILTHDVWDRPSQWGVARADYADLLTAIDASGAEVVTVGEMVDRLEKPASASQRAVA